MPRPYYGWIPLTLAALSMAATLPGRTLGLGLVTEPLLADLPLDRVTYGTLNLWATLLGATFSLAAGPLLDRLGARVVLTANALLLGLAVLWMARLTATAHFAVALILVRGLGQSALSVVAMAVVGKWFVRRINTAMAVYSAIVAVAFMAAIVTVQHFVRTAGWRPTWAAIAYALFALSGISLLLARRTPESIGIPATHPELQPAPTPDPADSTDATHPFTLRQALRTGAFWTFALAAAVFNLIFSGVALFSQAILRERGFNDTTTYDLAMAILALSGIAANGLGGLLAGRIPLHRLMALGMLGVTASLVILPLATHRAVVFAYAALLGSAGGVVTVVFFACWPRVFGRPHLGHIQGAAQVLTVLFSALGPVLLALGQRQASYANTFLSLAPLVALISLACYLTRPPQPPPLPST